MLRTNTILNTLVFYTVSTGAITGLCSVILIITLRIGNTVAFIILNTVYGASEFAPPGVLDVPVTAITTLRDIQSFLS